jgi:hypothetical protein
MKLKDLFEQANIPTDVKDSLPPTYVMPKLQNSDYYKQYRHLVALAAARSRVEKGESLSPESVWGENQAVVCYTPADLETLKLANKIMGVTSEAISDTPSHEPKTTNKISPVRKFVDLSESTNSNMHKNGTYADAGLSMESAQKLHKWCLDNGIPCIDFNKLHVTLLFSRAPVPQIAQLNQYKIHKPAKIIKWEQLGESLALMIDSPVAHKIHNFCIKHGGTHDYDEYIPHITISYNWNKPLPTNLPTFPVVLDEIRVNELDTDWKDKL